MSKKLMGLVEHYSKSTAVLAVCAVLMTGLAAAKVADLAAAVAKSKAVGVTIERSYLAGDALLKIVRAESALNPALIVELNAQKNGIVISAKQKELYLDFQIATSAIISSEGVLWEATRVCMGSCGGSAALIELRGFVNTAVFKS